jgi:RHS repeat-associated protein
MLVRDASGGETAYTYDEVGNRVAMTDALGRVRKYEYDSLGRMTAEVKPLGQRKTTTYDAVGQPISMRDYNGRASAMSYDPRGRLIHTRHGDGTETRYAYTVTGQLALVQDATGVTTFVYDDQDRLIEQVRPGGQTLRYGYDAEGNRTRLETPSGTTIFGYDAAGRPSTILDAQGGLTSYGYDAAGNRTSLTQPNGVTTTYARDDRDRLTTIESRTATNTLLARYAYTLDAAGNRTGVTEHGGRTVGWQYDALYRLVAETITEPAGSPETESFGYDAVGNRVLRATDAGVETSVYDDNDRLLDDGTATYTWDDQGNLRSKTVGAETTTYRWDGRDRLIEVSGPSTGLVQHVYDHAGDRVETRVDGVATKYLVDANRGLSEILEERTSAGSLIASYVHSDGGLPLARFDSVTWTSSYYLHDAQHSVRQLASVGGAVTDAYSYSAFGIARGATGSTPNAYRYDGEWNDARTQLYHFRARWLGPGAGGFLSSDPFAGLGMQPGSLHRYLFNLGNPISRSDPSGAFSMAEVGAAVQIAGTLASIAIPTFRAAQDLRAGVPLAEVTQQLAYEASINIASSVVAGGILRWAPRLLRLRPFGWMTPLGGRAARSVWSTVAGIAGNRARGEAIERIVLAGERRLPWNYPVIDDFLDNIAHSIKSIDLTAASNTATTIASTIRREARRLAEFVPQDWGAARLAGQTVAGRRLTVVFETGAADELQEQALRAVAREVRANLPEVLLEFRWIQ